MNYIVTVINIQFANATLPENVDIIFVARCHRSSDSYIEST